MDRPMCVCGTGLYYATIPHFCPYHDEWIKLWWRDQDNQYVTKNEEG